MIWYNWSVQGDSCQLMEDVDASCNILQNFGCFHYVLFSLKQ